MPTGSLAAHTALAAALLSAWLLVESVRNNQLTLELVRKQSRLETLRSTAQTLNESVQARRERLAAADRLANSVGPAILRDLVALSAHRRNPAIADLLAKHGIKDPSESPAPSAR